MDLQRAILFLPELGFAGIFLGVPLLLTRVFLGKFFPFCWIGIIGLFIWWGLAPLLAKYLPAEQRYMAFIVWNFLVLVGVVGPIAYCWIAGESWKSIALALLFQSYAIVCAWYYGGIQVTHKFDRPDVSVSPN